MIKPDDVAFIKTTGEAVFVLRFFESDEWDQTVSNVDVRRPIMGQKGCKHVIETFRVAELETLEEQREKYLAEQEERVKRFTKPSADATFNSGFPIN